MNIENRDWILTPRKQDRLENEEKLKLENE